MSLLTICQTVADVVGIPRPSAIVSSTDTQVRRLFALANLEGKALAARYEWQELISEATFTTVATDSQGAISTLAPGYLYVVNGTMWNRDTQEPIAGSMSAQRWQAEKATVSAGPFYDYRIRGGNLLFYPTPTAGDNVYFEYRSKNWCESSGGTGQAAWAADNDVGVLDEDLMALGLRWRFLQSAGLDYGESFREYEQRVGNAMARDGSKRTLWANEGTGDYRPTVRAPDGSWNL